MRRRLSEKLNSVQGMSRIFSVLLILIIIMCVVISIPTLKSYLAYTAEKTCEAGLDTARRRLAENYLSGNYDQSARDAKEAVTIAMNGWDDLCPSGGKVYLIENKNSEMPFDLFCGLHGKDKKRCTRLNAGYVFDQLEEALMDARRDGVLYPEELSFYLNGKTWTALLTDEETGLKRGTSTTQGLENKHIVAYYGIAGHSDFFAGSRTKEGHICYFSFADENHCANWSDKDGWYGDSYGSR